MKPTMSSRTACIALMAGALLLAGCKGTSAPDIAGSWRTVQNLSFPGSSTEMTLLSNGQDVAGTGVAHVEAGADVGFTVTGKISTPLSGQLAFHYTDGTAESFAFALPDPDHITLISTRTLSFTREQ